MKMFSGDYPRFASHGDVRLSKLMRRLTSDDEKENKLLASRQLRDYLFQSDNRVRLQYTSSGMYVAFRFLE